jgi:hypothetical protein
MHGSVSSALLSEDNLEFSTPLEHVKQPSRPPSRSVVDTIRSKTSLRGAKEPATVRFFI